MSCRVESPSLCRTYSEDSEPQLMSPLHGNVVFTSSRYNVCFSLRSFANIYASVYGGFDANMFTRCLWGDIYFEEKSRKFVKKMPKRADAQETPRTFVHFILTPLYKIFSQVASRRPVAHVHILQIVGDVDTCLPRIMQELGIKLSATEQKMNVRPLISLVCRRFFGDFQALVDVITQHVKPPSDASQLKVAHAYSGPPDAPFTTAISSCDPDVSWEGCS